MTSQIRNDSLPDLKAAVTHEVERLAPTLRELSHAIHAQPELSWEEHAAAARVASLMRAQGFAVTEAAYGVETAVEAVYGDGDLTIALCAEYDALPGVGHACGHNVIAAIGVGAALALKPVAQAAGLRIKLLGTPAEEHGGGKVSLLQAGAFEDADYSMMVHGYAGVDRRADASSHTACDRFQVTFTGREAHAAAAPHAALNAGAAATLAVTAIAFLRQHIVKNANLNAFISDHGGATNVIPGTSVVQVEVRALDLDVWRDLKQRTLACFEGAAIATGTSYAFEQTEHPYAPLITDSDLASFWDANLTARGRELVAPPVGGGSTDMGNVSQVVPAIHPLIGFLGETAVPHHPDFAASAASPAADRAIVDGAVALAQTTLDAALSPDVRARLQRAKAERRPGATRISLSV